jgi:hypothetical protein
MEFRLLGAFEIRDGDTEGPAVRRQERLLLAALLLKANELIAVAELVDLLWPVEPWPVQVQLRPAKASLAFANGEPETGREIIREVIEKARGRGDAQLAAAFQQHLDELEEDHRNGR